MTANELAQVRQFTQDLPLKRQQVADGPLLDQCQIYLDQMLAHIDVGENPYEVKMTATPSPAPEPPRYIDETPPPEPPKHVPIPKVTKRQTKPHHKVTR